MSDKSFDYELQSLTISHAPKPIAKCGDIVTTLWGDWKREHKVMIYEVDVQIVSLTHRRFRQDNETLEEYIKDVPIMGVEHGYYALRLDKNNKPKEKYGIALTNFKTSDGQDWEKKHKDFNHYGLAFTIAKIPENER